MPKKEKEPQSTERTYRVKLYHPQEDGVRCAHSGKSVRFEQQANDKADLRTKVETNQSREGIFAGDKCKSCGSLAKVSLEVQINKEWKSI